jgi:hypothetical protein
VQLHRAPAAVTLNGDVLDQTRRMGACPCSRLPRPMRVATSHMRPMRFCCQACNVLFNNSTHFCRAQQGVHPVYIRPGRRNCYEAVLSALDAMYVKYKYTSYKQLVAACKEHSAQLVEEVTCGGQDQSQCARSGLRLQASPPICYGTHRQQNLT